MPEPSQAKKVYTQLLGRYAINRWHGDDVTVAKQPGVVIWNSPSQRARVGGEPSADSPKMGTHGQPKTCGFPMIFSRSLLSHQPCWDDFVVSGFHLFFSRHPSFLLGAKPGVVRCRRHTVTSGAGFDRPWRWNSDPRCAGTPGFFKRKWWTCHWSLVIGPCFLPPPSNLTWDGWASILACETAWLNRWFNTPVSTTKSGWPQSLNRSTFVSVHDSRIIFFSIPKSQFQLFVR